MIDWQVSGSGEESGTIDTGLDWDEIYANPDEPFTWVMQDQPGYEPIEIDLGDGHMAYIDGIDICIKADPYIDFGFAARSYDGDTHFLFSSDLLILNPALAVGAEASAIAKVMGQVSVGDFDDSVYLAEYNGGTEFAKLVSAPVNGYKEEAAPSVTMTEEISSMQVHWGFTVPSGEQAGGLSTFTITGDVIPEPASVLLLGLGGLALRRKRRL